MFATIGSLYYFLRPIPRNSKCLGPPQLCITQGLSNLDLLQLSRRSSLSLCLSQPRPSKISQAPLSRSTLSCFRLSFSLAPLRRCLFGENRAAGLNNPILRACHAAEFRQQSSRLHVRESVVAVRWEESHLRQEETAIVAGEETTPQTWSPFW